MYIEEWREVFLLAAEVYLFGAAIYAILGDGKKQWWADGDYRRNKKQNSSIPLPLPSADCNKSTLEGSIQVPR